MTRQSPRPSRPPTTPGFAWPLALTPGLLSLALLPVALLAPGCSENSLAYKGSADAYDTGGHANTPVDTGGTSTDTGGSETEDPYFKLPPAGTDAYVFVANPDRNTVTRIQVPQLTVDTATVGTNPTQVQTTADYKRAVTLNEGSDDISIIDAVSFTVDTVAIRDNFNAMSLSGDGKWAAAWYDPNAPSAASSGGIQTFNEVSFVNLDAKVHTPMVVGFNPRGIRWSADGTLAVVVSDASLAVIDLTATTLSPQLVSLSDDPVNAPAAEEVELSPDSNWAFVRQFGTNSIVLVDLHNLTAELLPVGENPTDEDLSPDGSEMAVMARGSHELWIFDPVDPLASPRVVSTPADNTYGSVVYAGDGSQALLYTNASAVSEFATWNTSTDVITERALEKPVETIAISPTGGSALIFHTQTDAADADPSSPFYGNWALTLVDLTDFRQNPILLPAEPTGYSTTTDGKYGFYLLDGYNFLEVLDFGTMLPEEITLKSPPVFVGNLPDTDIAFASQENNLGRISFYTADSGTLDTITGFELNSQIDHEE